MNSGKNNGGTLNSHDLESLNAGNARIKASDTKNNNPDDLRSVRSEYDYGSKKKFVDILGNFKKNNLNHSGLEGLD